MGKTKLSRISQKMDEVLEKVSREYNITKTKSSELVANTFINVVDMKSIRQKPKRKKWVLEYEFKI